MSILERLGRWCNKGACTCWVTKFKWVGKSVDMSSACTIHDLHYMRVSVPTVGKLKADMILAKTVWKMCKPMAVIMWLGLTLLPVSYLMWYRYGRNHKESNSNV